MAKIKNRKGTPSVTVGMDAFAARLKAHFYDPAFEGLQPHLRKIVDVAWDAYADGRKSPRTRPAGKGYSDPSYELFVEWLATRDTIAQAERRQKSSASRSRILLMNGSPRNEHTCPGEMSKTARLVETAGRAIERARGFEVERLDLSRLTAEYGLNILPHRLRPRPK